MNQPRSRSPFCAVVILALAAARTVFAGPPADRWIDKDIGSPSLTGSTDVDANGVWTIKGGGDDVFGTSDNFHFAYQPVKGDASITARLLSRRGGDPDWAKAGLMIRDDDSSGSPNLALVMVHAVGLSATVRAAQDGDSIDFGAVGAAIRQEMNLFLRLQRVGSEVAAFYSKDGQLWNQAGFAPRLLPSLKEEALFGLAATAHDDEKLVTGQFDQVNVQPGEVSAYGILASGGDQSVLLQWRPVPEALGFHLYRGPANASVDQLLPLTTVPGSGTSFTDTSEGLVNGTPVSYAIAPVLKSADGKEVQGPLVAVSATPVKLPPGWSGCSINEGAAVGSAAFDPPTGQITLRGSGDDIWGADDQCYFVSQLLEGDAQITVKALTKPQQINSGPRTGLMIRESLEGSARRAFLALTPYRGLAFGWRDPAGGFVDWPGSSAIESDDLQVPITLRLTRIGGTITPEYSTDDGQTFQPAGDPLSFDPDLPRTLSMGLAISSLTRGLISQEQFSGLEVKKLDTPPPGQ